MFQKKYIRKLLKLLFVAALITIFIKFFGISAVEKYFEKRTIFSEEYLEYEKKDQPNILLSHIKFEQSGFRSLQKPIIECIKINENNFNKTVQCIENVTFSKEEYINADHTKGKVSIRCLLFLFNGLSANWTTTFGPFSRGRAFIKRQSIRVNRPITLDLAHQTQLEIFDPKFYMFTERTAVNPRLRLLIKEGYLTYGNIKIEKFHLLKGKYQCSTDTDYSFTDCIQVCFPCLNMYIRLESIIIY